MDKLFLCPLCGKILSAVGKSLMCEKRHCYDVASSGYVNLLPVNKKNSVFPGDNKEMTEARKIVMDRGYYLPLAEKIAEIAKKENPGFILDAGCGTGYIPYMMKKILPNACVVGTDISKFAIDTAAKKYKEPRFAVASSKNLPIEGKKADVIICAFAPVYPEEFLRVNKTGGLFLRVVPAEKHLYDLKKYLYETPRENVEDVTEYEGYEKLFTETVDGEFTGNAEEIKALVKMTPYYYHTSEEILKKLDEITFLTVNTSFEIHVFRKK